ncbi:HPP family-domain-containing protein [Lobosporangium transversale]|uniref:HPP family-domain-containing protein n=1 Tax=Lobosporangium transversale TaxID=64571 RepID=A0A1Y2GEQ3_9FUNG|nr:HPP family-domain-containing protein [Lobosporangium transversale]ORZ08805.1 HPP family-domain-containing protein [Lobosporangium transversale]|eukprot:XP_021878588.1 HPP family-domain-containing protein [Lobosporangium transversale]
MMAQFPALEAYVSRMTGQRHNPDKLRAPPKAPPSRLAVLLSSFIGSFVGIAIVSSLTYNAQWFIDRNVPVMAGSFGASAVLIYGAIEAPLSQPRNVIGGHIMSSLIGVSLYKLFNLLSPETFAKLHWLLCSLAVSISLFCMQLTHTVHPPASATALIAVSGGQTLYDLGYWYVLCPIGLGVALMMIVALIVNNVARKYPTHWWNPKKQKIAVIDQDMATSIADYVPDNDDNDDDEQATRDGNSSIKQQDANTAVPAIAITGSSSASSTVNELANTSSPTISPSHHPRSPSHSHSSYLHEPQYAVYYGGEHHRILRDGERLHQDQTDSDTTTHDLEHGPKNQRHQSSILIRMRSFPNSPHLSSGTHSHGSHHTEESYRSTIERLQQRIQELENQLAAASPVPDASK